MSVRVVVGFYFGGSMTDILICLLLIIALSSWIAVQARKAP